ncbi:Gfo/Idh/MocA family protein [Campylobacter sp. RM16192]|uniref:Gfo/Idh/MocA family protein n=1 Tax=Campylobacter sp. RM16192 TaxID=1660080 RepID=UPI001451A4C5|nr:Gfo/Idh/MocA family oxidoreductase [Campylobacter sp. RM16192]QCD52308.1 oxidoreductase, Gfo/Idh/MocA family [Campylobacter sp. RM16192]
MLKFAIVGLGVMGKNHYRAIKNVAGVKIVSLCDPFIKENFAHKIYSDLDEMLISENLDAAIIATPTSLHKEAALKCMEKGLNLLIEKPVCSNVNDAKILLMEAIERNIKVAVGYIERFNPAIVALKKELENEEIYSIQVTRNAPFPQRIADVGILTDLAVHDIDLIRFISGKEIKSADIKSSRKIHDKFEDNAVLSFELDGDIMALITTSWLSYRRKRTVEVTCKGVVYEADLLNQSLVKFSEFNMNSYKTQNIFVKRTDSLTSEIEDFLCLLNSEQSTGADVNDSLKTLKIIESMGQI